MTKTQKDLFVGKTIKDITNIGHHGYSKLKIEFTDGTIVVLTPEGDEICGYAGLYSEKSNCSLLRDDVEYTADTNWFENNDLVTRPLPVIVIKNKDDLNNFINQSIRHSQYDPAEWPITPFNVFDTASGGLYVIADTIVNKINKHIVTDLVIILHIRCSVCGGDVPVSFEIGNGIGTPVPTKCCCSKCGADLGDKTNAAIWLGISPIKPFFNYILTDPEDVKEFKNMLETWKEA